jgi:ABC-type antimicrobial peptide transport system permease subunit
MALLPVVAEAEPLPEVDGGEVYKQGSVAQLVFRTFTRNKLAVVGVVIVVLMVLFCFVGPLFYHTDQVDTNIINSNDAPSGSHLLGTDNNGFDILGRLMKGGQSSIEIAFCVAIIATFIGVVYGAIAGYLGKFVDAVMMRVVDILLDPGGVPFHLRIDGRDAVDMAADRGVVRVVVACAGPVGTRRNLVVADP